MPYYVYAIHTDQTSNRLYEEYDNLIDAEAKETDMRKGCFPHDNYFVKMLKAENAIEAESKADALRPYPMHQNNRSNTDKD